MLPGFHGNVENFLYGVQHVCVTTLIRCYQERAPKRTESKIIIILRMRNAMYMYMLHNSPLL